jgi:TetR/AcrR family transcriptional regulator
MSAEPAPIKKTRIQQRREKLILDCALDVFATYGFYGATIDQIAGKAVISKPNLLYYFRSKEEMYVAILERTLVGWLDPFLAISADGDPVEELTTYISAKMDMSFANPLASRLFAMEVQSGAPQLGDAIRTSLKQHVDEKAAILQQWMDQGKLRQVDPRHFIFSMWSVTQHYADFAVQVEGLLGGPCDPVVAKQAVTEILLRGIVPAASSP